VKRVKYEVIIITYLCEYMSDFMEGENLGNFLAKPTPNKADLAILDPDINEAKLNGNFE
jgi:hypothetical protein